MPESALLVASDLVSVLRVDSADVRVLDGVSVELHSGTVTDITGPSGCGKSTLLRALGLLLPGAAGSLSLDGVPCADMGAQHWRASVALLPQKPAIFPGTVAENLRVPWSLKVRHGQLPPDDAALCDALERVGLPAAALDRDAARLSVGQQARVALLRVFLTNPRVLLLDEPDAALDETSSESVALLLREFTGGGGAIARVRHHLADGLATRCLALAGGHLTLPDGVAAR